jgi:uncharacterized Zn-binding protein involved in type VI secretion
MTRELIVLGDTTTHGGQVVGCSSDSDIDGKGIARKDDEVVCPLHGKTVITSGDPNMEVDGQPAARHGDSTSCGATLIASQATTFRP